VVIGTCGGIDALQPGSGEANYEMNTFNMFHGAAYDGKWFRATDAWDRVVKLLLGKARAAGQL
jgi:hypothetical protein